ncbi:RNA polymerase, sigma subunit, SigV [Quadrisphaera granulorum]|uniref:RNA polymerase sigma (SigV) subunit n=1 Tax=Quadrisphaera granulorum TaxID=317664 RepID=A0A316AEM0_9ACTN|nr:sigma-70 family RNA polymerase sigma factor [Quadrisphaera granulorum]PWJ56226.1 RNA polymerase sigma (SigV) subunit [Quadrisphaera granulorum]SZE94860.1 RNA polymerase, sigma subunit, SigV [Quadrisphaera granulorum]
MSRWRRPDPAERTAFEEFVQQRGQALAGLARGLTSSAADAEDLLQDVLATVLERWERVAAADDTYLYARRVMVNASTSTWRRRHREMHEHSAEHVMAGDGRDRGSLWFTAAHHDDGDGEHRVLLLDERRAALEALRQLPPRQRAVVVLRYVEELPDAEIAALLDVTSVTVRSTAMRALRTLRGLLMGS